jgi:NitT/TauT family transport system ATP-binding protein
MSSRPGRIIADVVVPMARPRSIRELQTNSEFHHTYTQVWRHLEEGWTHHEG